MIVDRQKIRINSFQPTSTIIIDCTAFIFTSLFISTAQRPPNISHSHYFVFLHSPNMHYEYLCTHQTMKCQCEKLYMHVKHHFIVLSYKIAFKYASRCWKWRTNAELSIFSLLFCAQCFFIMKRSFILCILLTYAQFHM